AQAEREAAKREAAQEKFKKAQEAAWGTKVMTAYSRLLHEEGLKQRSTPAGYSGRMQEFGEGAIEELLSDAPSGEAQLVVRGRLKKHLADNLNRGSTWEYGQLLQEQKAGQEERIVEAEKAAYLGQDRYEVWAELMPDVEAFNVTYGGPGARGRERSAEARRRVNWFSAMGILEENPGRLQDELDAGAWDADLPAADLQKLSAKLGLEINRQEGEEYEGYRRNVWNATEAMGNEEAIAWLKDAKNAPGLKDTDRRTLVNAHRTDLTWQRKDEELATAQAEEDIERDILQKWVAGTGNIKDVMDSGLPTARQEHWIKAFEAAAKEGYDSDPELKNRTLRQAYERKISKRALLNLVGKKPGLTGPDAEHRIKILESAQPDKAPYMRRAFSIFDAARKDGVYKDDFEWARAVNAFEKAVIARDARGQDILDIAENIMMPERDSTWAEKAEAVWNWAWSIGKEFEGPRPGERPGDLRVRPDLRAGPETEETKLRARAIELLRLNQKKVDERTIKIAMDRLRKAAGK
ncbi:hypothetical protein LCGC14_0996220, partial [marine sediment metagenome]